MLNLTLKAFNGRMSMNRKRRVTKTVILLTVTFIILWLPVHSIGMWYRLDPNFPQHFVLYVLKMIAHTMAYSNASINPIIYAFSNESVRTGLVNLLLWTRCGLGRYGARQRARAAAAANRDLDIAPAAASQSHFGHENEHLHSPTINKAPSNYVFNNCHRPSNNMTSGNAMVNANEVNYDDDEHKTGLLHKK